MDRPSTGRCTPCRGPSPAAATCSVRAGGDGWPWPYEVTLAAEARDASLSLRWRLTNLADEPMPAGMGFHPWWRRPIQLRVDAGLAYASNITSDARSPARSAGRSTSAAWPHQPTGWTAPGPMRRCRRSSWPGRSSASRAAIAASPNARYVAVATPTGPGRDRRRAADPRARRAAAPAGWPGRWPGVAAGRRESLALDARDRRQPWLSGRAAIRTVGGAPERVGIAAL